MSASVCPFVCLFQRSPISQTKRPNFTKFYARMLLAAVSRSSVVGTAIRYVLPLLSMTSCLTINRPNKDDARKASILEVSHWRGATLQEFYTVVHTQTGSPWSTTRPGGEV